MNGWEWRIAHPISALGSDRFHAYGPDNYSACKPSTGLNETYEPPNEGSSFCSECMAVVRVTPAAPR